MIAVSWKIGRKIVYTFYFISQYKEQINCIDYKKQFVEFVLEVSHERN